jgi:hypothetical protein
MKTLCIFLVVVALVAGMVGCVGGNGGDGDGSHTLIVDFTAGGTVAVDDVPLPGKAILTYDAGTVVSISAAPSGNYRFVEWTGNASTIDDVNTASTTIVVDDDYYITANFIAIDLYFEAGAHVMLSGAAALPLEERNPCVVLEVSTNMIVDSVRVDLPDERSVTVARYTDVFSPGVDWATSFRFVAYEPGMPMAGAAYTFTGLDETGEPIPGARGTDMWVGTEPPDPPTNVRAEMTEDGILVSWDDSPIIPGSFEPAAEPQLGCYQLEVDRTDTGESVYGAGGVSVSAHLIPRDNAHFTEKDFGLSLSEMEDGVYWIVFGAHSVAPAGSLGKGAEYINHDMGQAIVLTVEDGEITVR